MGFFKWIFQKAGLWIREQNEQFRFRIRCDFSHAVVMWIVFTIMVMASLGMIGLTFIHSDTVLLCYVLIQLAVAVAYFVYNCVVVMYQAYQAERNKLFEILKGKQ